MSRFTRFIITLTVGALALLVPFLGIAEAQHHPEPHHPHHPPPGVVVRGHVFIGGYFYDPFYGPYPWWPRAAYPYWYFPIYDNRGEVRLRVQPKEAEHAAVYVDGFYAGIVDDFNNVFQSLPLTPGGHTMVLYFDGYRTVKQNIYISPGSSFTLRATMERLPAGATSEPPEVAPPMPAPPEGTYRTPVTPPRRALPQPTVQPVEAAGFGALDIFVQPTNAEVVIDGQRWATAVKGHFVVQVPAGKHRVEVKQAGYRPFTTEIEVGDGQTVPVNVSLMTTSC